MPAARECRTHSGLQLGSKGLRADFRAAAFVEGAGGQAEAADSDEGMLQILLWLLTCRIRRLGVAALVTQSV